MEQEKPLESTLQQLDLMGNRLVEPEIEVNGVRLNRFLLNYIPMKIGASHECDGIMHEDCQIKKALRNV